MRSSGIKPLPLTTAIPPTSPAPRSSCGLRYRELYPVLAEIRQCYYETAGAESFMYQDTSAVVQCLSLGEMKDKIRELRVAKRELYGSCFRPEVPVDSKVWQCLNAIMSKLIRVMLDIGYFDSSTMVSIISCLPSHSRNSY